jgi:CxxC-x17-CxxC domain-containing protein
MTHALTDQQITCVDCELAFTFTVPEQLFYAERGIKQPVRCPACRARRRAERYADVVRDVVLDSTAPPAAWNESFGSYGGAPSAGPRRGPRAGVRMYSATCASCGRATQVPFEPRGSRPVYCRECFNARRGR